LDVLNTVFDFSNFRNAFSDSVGFVPTMGALHEGHLSLIRKSKKENKITVCSIFVNPIQFNNQADFDKYPNTLEQDLKLLEAEGCDLVFVPSSSEMYPTKPSTKFDFGALEHVMEGAFRPGHFSGVAIVVSKLFNIVRPKIAYFGQKDLQQTLVVKQLVADLGFQLKLDIVETAREKDGLAMSSRNLRLQPSLRAEAPLLYAELLKAKSKLLKGESIEMVSILAKHSINAIKNVKIEYFEIADATTLQPIKNNFKGEVAICVAAFFGDVRLIDNVVFLKK
jgi:pantoate--beta-alanine ligase